jgi:hypothetical protein
MHYVFKTKDSKFVGVRKETGNLYEKRPTVVTLLSEARIFNTKAAATNAGKAAGEEGQSVQVAVIAAA